MKLEVRTLYYYILKLQWQAEITYAYDNSYTIRLMDPKDNRDTYDLHLVSIGLSPK